MRDGAHAGNQLGWNGTGWTTAAPTATLGSGDPRCKMPDGTLSGLSTSAGLASFPINARVHLRGSGSYCPIWTHDWGPDTLQRYFAYQGVSVIPTGNGWSSCKMPEQAHCKLAMLSRSVTLAVSLTWKAPRLQPCRGAAAGRRTGASSLRTLPTWTAG